MSDISGPFLSGSAISGVAGAPRGRRLITLAVMIAVTGLSLAACSSKSSGTPSASGNSGTTTSSSSGSTGTSTSTTASAGSSAIAKLEALTNSVDSAKHGTFKLSYAETSSTTGGSSSNTFTFEQMPPKYLFGIDAATKATIIDTGTKTYTCVNSGGHNVCISYGTTDPFASLLSVITGDTVVTQFAGLRSGLAAKLAGVSATFSTQTIAGQSVQCVSGVKGADTFKYCLTQSGVLAYSGGSTATGGGAITLTSYSTSVSASDFALPAGATIESG
jgi:hypothetical protein